MGNYEYRCIRCGSEDIVFKELKEKDVTFDCLVCRKKFSVKDQESGYLHKKVFSLKERYPDRLRERNNKAARFQSKRKKSSDLEEIKEETESLV